MRNDQLDMPDIYGKTPEQQIKALYDHCHDAAIRLMRVNTELEELKQKVAQLESQR